MTEGWYNSIKGSGSLTLPFYAVTDYLSFVRAEDPATSVLSLSEPLFTLRAIGLYAMGPAPLSLLRIYDPLPFLPSF